jgi:hypothetical protein
MFAPEQLDHLDASSPLVSPTLSPDSLAPSGGGADGGPPTANGNASGGKHVKASGGGKKQARKASTVNVRNW